MKIKTSNTNDKSFILKGDIGHLRKDLDTYIDICTFENNEEITGIIDKISGRNELSCLVILTSCFSLALERVANSSNVTIYSLPLKNKETNLKNNRSFLPFNFTIENSKSLKEYLGGCKKIIATGFKKQKFIEESFTDETERISNIIIVNESIQNQVSNLDVNGGIVLKINSNNVSRFSISFDRELYSKEFINQLINVTENFILALKDSDQKISDIDVLKEDITDNSEEPILSGTILSDFHQIVLEYPHLISAIDEKRSVSYEELEAESNMVANHIIELKISGLIGVYLNKSVESLIFTLGVLKSGHSFLPLDPEHSSDRVGKIIDNAAVELLITTSDLFLELDYFEGETLFSDIQSEIFEKSNELNYTEISGLDSAYVIYTSGSTGTPKGVEISHSSLKNTILWSIENYKYQPANSTILFFSLAFDSSLLVVFSSLCSGGQIIIPNEKEKLNSNYLKQLIKNNLISHLYLVPSLYKELLNTITNEITGLNHIVLGGESISKALVESHFHLAPKVRLFNEYGPTENTITSTVFEYSKNNIPNVPIIGDSINGINLKIFNNKFRSALTGTVGEIYLSGCGLAKGYFRNESLTKEKFVVEQSSGKLWYKTGDHGRYQFDGTLEILGREDSQIKIRGNRLEIGEVEHLIEMEEKVDEVVVEAIYDENSEEYYLVAFIISQDGIDQNQLLTDLKLKMPFYMVPQNIIKILKFPLNENGKVDRKELRLLFSNEITISDDLLVLPKTDTEKKLLDIWKVVLSKESISTNDNFFNIGGHSLKAVKVITEIYESFGKNISIGLLFDNNTIASLAIILDGVEEGSGEDLKIPIAKSSSKYPLSSSQRRIWLLSQMEGGKYAYNMPGIYSFNGELNIEKFKSAFLFLIKRHESLRTVFKEDLDENIYQYILEPNELEFTVNYEDFRNSSSNELELKLKEEINHSFDLENGPLLKVSLFKTGEDQYILIFIIHHIVSDGWSMGVLLRDLISIYNLSKESNSITPLTINYKDYSVWQQNQLLKETLKNHKEFWINEFSGELPALNLPYDNPRPKIKTFNGAKINGVISKEKNEKLHALLRQIDGTLFMGLLGVIKTLLFRYSNQEDIIVGSPVAGRDLPGLHNQIGFYANTLALRTRFTKNDNFWDLLEKIREVTLNAYEHQSYPFDELVGELNLTRDHSRNPIFDVMLELENNDLTTDGESLGDIEIKPYKTLFSDGVSKFDLTFSFIDKDDELSYNITYNKDVFSERLINQLNNHFNSLLDSIIENPDQSICKIDYLSLDEKNILLHSFNDTKKEFSKENTIVNLFENQVKNSPNNIALIYGENSYTYNELNEISNELSNYLKQNLTINPDDLIGIKQERSEWLLISMLAVMKSDAAYVPLDPNYPKDRISYILTETKCKAVLDLEELNKFKVARSTGKLSSLNGNHYATSSNLAYVIFTSGSTGKPKGVMVEHCNVVNFLNGMDSSLGEIGSNSTLTAVTSMSFDISVLELFWPIVNGSKVVLSFNESSNDSNRVFSTKPLDFSLFYFSSQVENEEDKYDLLLESAKYADKNGYSAVWTPERHFNEFGGIYSNPSVTSAALSTVTENIRIRSGSVVLPLHNPVRVAEEWSMVDNLSKGRVDVSFASGWVKNDFEALSPGDFENRHSKLYENIEVVKSLWSGSSLNIIDGIDVLDDVKIYPKPIQKELPIWLTSGGNPETFVMAGKLGLNLLTHLLGQTVKSLGDNIALYREAWKEANHEGEGHISLMIHTFLDEDMDKAKLNSKEPFKTYLKSSLGLVNSLAKSMGYDTNSESFSSNDLEAVLDHGFNRYFDTASLMGTVNSRIDLLHQLSLVGVNELACLIDFGINKSEVLRSLELLTDLKSKYSLENSQAIDSITKSISVLDLIAKNKTTHFQCTPSLMKLLLKEKGAEKSLSSINTLMIGGENFPNQLLSDLQSNYSGSIFNMYGPTETTIWSSVAKLDKDICIGKPISNTNMFILDSNKQLVPIGVSGDIYISGNGVTRGYLNREDLTFDRYIVHPFKSEGLMYKTGDSGRWLPNGDLDCFGRNDDQVKVRGHRIELGEIEFVLNTHEVVSDCVVIVSPDIEGANMILAYLILESGENLNLSEIYSFLRKSLPDYMLPSKFFELEEFPLTPNGKIDKRTLSSLGEGLNSGVEYLAPSTALEHRLVKIWEELLERKKIGVLDDFFELGGDSLMAIKLLSRIHKELNVKLELKDLFSKGTLKEQAILINESTESLFEEIKVAPKLENYPLSSGQRRLWILSQFENGNIAYNEIGISVLKQDLKLELFNKSIQYLISRHEILRTTFKVDEEGEVKQFIDLNPDKFQFDYQDLSSISDDLNNKKIEKEIIKLTSKPFDLMKGPLMRIGLLKVNKNEHVLVSVIHHIVSDGWSRSLMENEILSIYNFLLHGNEVKLEPLRIQYKDYAFWQQNQLKKSNLKDHRAYWLEQFNGELPILNLPSDFTRPAIKTFNGGSVKYFINESFKNNLKNITTESGSTLFMGLLSLINSLFYRYTSQDDIIIGIPITGRDHLDLENQIGFYVNTLALRTKFNGNDSFQELLGKVKDTTLGAFDNQIYPFDELIDQLNLNRDMSRNPLFDVMVILNKNEIDIEDQNESEIELTTYKVNDNSVVSKFDLTFNFIELSDGINLEIIYNSDLFRKETIEQMSNHLVNLLDCVVSNPNTSINTLNYLSKEEEHKLLVTFNDTSENFPRHKTIVDLFEEQAEKKPDNIALVYGDNSYSYQELNELSNELSDYLKSTYSIGTDNLVGIHQERSEWFLISMLGVLKSNAAYVPLDLNYPEERISYILSECDCKVVLNEQELEKFKRTKGSGVLEKSNSLKEIDSSDLAYVIFTSGSTGKPKGVMVEHGNVLNFLCSMDLSLGEIGENSTLQAVTSMSFDISVLELFWPLVNGSKVIIASDLDILSVSELIVKHKASHFQCTPSMMKILLKEKSIKNKLSSVHTLMIGGESFPEHLLSDLKDHYSGSIYNMYGPTETTIWSSTSKLQSKINIGKPISNTAILVLDDNKKLVPTGVFGSLYIAGEGVTRGYLNKEGLTNERYLPHPFKEGSLIYHTGDMGRWLSNGDLECLGRSDEQVKVNGNRIELGEIEVELNSHKSVSESITVMKQDESGDNHIVAYLVLNENQELNVREIKDHLRRSLPDYMLPSYYLSLDKFPLTPNGKIDKKSLIESEGENLNTNVKYVAPVSNTEKELVKIWAEGLMLDEGQVGITNDFFDLGGNSLKAMKLITKINKKYNVELNVRKIFINPTIIDIAVDIDFINFKQKKKTKKLKKIEI